MIDQSILTLKARRRKLTPQQLHVLLGLHLKKGWMLIKLAKDDEKAENEVQAAKRIFSNMRGGMSGLFNYHGLQAGWSYYPSLPLCPHFIQIVTWVYPCGQKLLGGSMGSTPALCESFRLEIMTWSHLRYLLKLKEKYIDHETFESPKPAKIQAAEPVSKSNQFSLRYRILPEDVRGESETQRERVETRKRPSWRPPLYSQMLLPPGQSL